jgi:hypothetical protein
MKKIYKAGRQHLHKAFAGDLESLLLLYSHRAELWRDPNYIREIPPALLFIDFLSKMRSEIAFQLVPVVADWLLSNIDQVGTDCRFWLLLSIAESSSTTEIPIRLKCRMESLRQAAMAHGDAAIEPFSQLLRYYRLDPNELPDENGAEQNAEPELPITGS